jgi:ubiquitin-like 1-activating enzyme E1 B
MVEGAREGTQMQFDKDDALAMRLVAAAANLRSRVFSIELQSFYDAKGIAGNIIPAIATTNAIVAGIQVEQAIKVLRGEEGQDACKLCSHVYVIRAPNRKGTLLQPTFPDPPSASCYVCNASQVELSIDTDVATLETVVKKVLKGRLGFNCPNVQCGADVLYEEGEGADEDTWANLPKTLRDFLRGDGAVITVDDFTQDLNLDVIVKHLPSEDLEALSGSAAEDGFVLGGLGELEKKQKQSAAAAAAAASGAASGADSSTGDDGIIDDDEVVCLDDESDAVQQLMQQPSAAGAGSEAAAGGLSSPSSRKRGREEDGGDEPEPKVAKEKE